MEQRTLSEGKQSPILLLKEQICVAPFKIAPEKADLCYQNFDKHNINKDFIIVDEKNSRIRVKQKDNPDSKKTEYEVVLPIAWLEYLWAFSHYIWVLCQEYASAQRTDATDFDCVGNDRLRESLVVLKWAIDNQDNSGSELWPEIGPRPKTDSYSYDDAHVASEIFLCAIAWIILHEIAHVVLKHPFTSKYSKQFAPAYSVQEEEQADKFATDWILDEVPQSDHRFKQKRCLGIAIAILFLQSLEVNTRPSSFDTHPAAHKRIFDNIRNSKCENEEAVNAICTIALQYLFHKTPVSALIDGDNFYAILNDFLYDIKCFKAGS